MKKGFKLYYLKEITEDERNQSISHLNDFIVKTCSDPKMRYFGKVGGGYDWMGVGRSQYIEFVTSIPWCFLRIRRNQRRFALVKKEHLQAINKNTKEFVYPVLQEHSSDKKIHVRLNPDIRLIEYASIGDWRG